VANLQGIFALEGDDAETATALRGGNCCGLDLRVVVVPVCQARTKPRALNDALAEARGAFVTI
jgi:hypothetical protein